MGKMPPKQEKGKALDVKKFAMKAMNEYITAAKELLAAQGISKPTSTVLMTTAQMLQYETWQIAKAIKFLPDVREIEEANK